MFFLRIMLMAVRSLVIHPMRSILATLGVIIGVAAVVAAMAILDGMGAKMATGFASMGSSRLFVFPPQQHRGGHVVGNIDAIKLDDAFAVGKECPALKLAMPQVIAPGIVKFLSKNTDGSILGATECYEALNSHKCVEGTFITKPDVQGRNKVVVLGAKVKRELFGGRPAIGERIQINGPLGIVHFTVVGVMESKGNVGFTDVDKQVIIPVTTAMEKIYGMKAIQMIVCDAASSQDSEIEKAKDQIKVLLRQRHKIRAGASDDFEVQSQKEFVQQFATFQKIVGVVLISIAGISLVVGGIGIMNIMLVSVTERTREIGVRMAMGAQRFDVLQQFMVEASVVSFLGGAMGVLLGWGLAQTIEKMTRVFETITTGGAIAMALGMATCVGIVSGIYPAWKASRLDPVEALRYE